MFRYININEICRLLFLLYMVRQIIDQSFRKPLLYHQYIKQILRVGTLEYLADEMSELTKQALVPLSFLHWASRLSNLPGRTRGRDSSSCGELYRHVAVSPLKNGKWYTQITKQDNFFPYIRCNSYSKHNKILFKGISINFNILLTVHFNTFIY